MGAASRQDFVQLCTADAIRTIASSIQASTVEPGKIANQPGPFLTDGVQYTPAKDGIPAFCQVTGSYVTNPETGKTSNFLATFPENWNGKYLQLGCGGHCGTFAVSNPAMFTITITNQGLPGDIIKKGYAAFATDQGHTEMTGGTWAIEGPGMVDDEAITDYLWRSSKVLTKIGKEFTRTFYARTGEARSKIGRSYFSGCSGGGRDALVAASYFPEEFDGIIAGSPYNPNGRLFHVTATTLATLRSPDARISQPQLDLFNRRVMAQCDGVDGVRDGLIQNPAACNFRPERDLPKCTGDVSGDQCFTQSQLETLSVVLTAVTDENGAIVQPGYAVSELGKDFAPAAPPADPNAEDPWPDTPMQQGGLWSLANAAIKVFAYRNDPAFTTRSIVSFRAGGPGPIRDFRGIVPRKHVDHVVTALRSGTGHFPENLDPFISQGRKLLIWQNLSDEKLPPFPAYNFYNELAARHGGHDELRQNVRLFGLPGTAHCSGGGIPVGPGNFDALTAMENWVEKGIAPNALTATLYQPTPYGVDFSKPLGRTMPLCAFPQMAHYKGSGDVKDAASWECRADDTRMLHIGESGKRAGVRN
ncbi:MAG: tannase/feruloyl esterase family alpha/beta hydrolase [Novosphingobium sp.]|nr:tannase/feruloyl esterase family alpha/beta hydrolase [Novosphingobium sp.]MCP5400869.1 tannase/feruloyl esterase family alpha/beta hydrolase [Novosphingobium sp.]